jgi:hypothetical protein
MSRNRLIGLVAVSIILAIPIVTLISALVVFPLIVYFAFAAVACFGPLAIAAAIALERLGIGGLRARVTEMWASCSILWVGCAFGLSRWGDAGSAIGARNEPYFKVLFLPYTTLYKYLIG